jgi:hypothetical protein
MPTNSSPKKTKNPAAVALGRLGGLKGGKARIKSLSKAGRSAFAQKGGIARAKKLSATELSESGRNAVLARWRKKKMNS